MRGTHQANAYCWKHLANVVSNACRLCCCCRCWCCPVAYYQPAAFAAATPAGVGYDVEADGRRVAKMSAVFREDLSTCASARCSSRVLLVIIYSHYIIIQFSVFHHDVALELARWTRPERSWCSKHPDLSDFPHLWSPFTLIKSQLGNRILECKPSSEYGFLSVCIIILLYIVLSIATRSLKLWVSNKRWVHVCLVLSSCCKISTISALVWYYITWRILDLKLIFTSGQWRSEGSTGPATEEELLKGLARNNWKNKININ